MYPWSIGTFEAKNIHYGFFGNHGIPDEISFRQHKILSMVMSILQSAKYSLVYSYDPRRDTSFIDSLHEGHNFFGGCNIYCYISGRGNIFIVIIPHMDYSINTRNRIKSHEDCL
uniref:Putative ovule protein n=1 Tax=Solanum chacoense TaxID=4108 RepID=A0A0V0H1P5_SOLCH